MKLPQLRAGKTYVGRNGIVRELLRIYNSSKQDVTEPQHYHRVAWRTPGADKVRRCYAGTFAEWASEEVTLKSEKSEHL